MFMVQLTSHKAFTAHSVIQFDRVMVNIGGGYISDNTSADYGKFIAPVTGSYQFIAVVFSENSKVGAFLHVNGPINIRTSSGPGGGTGVASTVVQLEKNDQVYLESTTWGANELNRYFSFFSGHLILPEI